MFDWLNNPYAIQTLTIGTVIGFVIGGLLMLAIVGCRPKRHDLGLTYDQILEIARHPPNQEIHILMCERLKELDK